MKEKNPGIVPHEAGKDVKQLSEALNSRSEDKFAISSGRDWILLFSIPRVTRRDKEPINGVSSVKLFCLISSL